MSISYAEAKNLLIASGLKLKSEAHYRECATNGSLPPELPKYPYEKFRNKGWISWGDFLGTGRISNQNKMYRSYGESLKFVHKLNLKNVNEWRAYAKSNVRPNDISSVPNSSYKKEWQNWGVWLGTGVVSDWNRTFRDFDLARKFVNNLNLKNQIEWQAYAKSNKKPDDIPSIPSKVYKEKGWTTWMDLFDQNK